MELSTFVADTLKQIIKGVQEAQAAVPVDAAHINPLINHAAPAGKDFVFTHRGTIQLVNFDIAVSVTEGSNTAGKASVGVATAFGAGGSKESTSSEDHSSRIRFVVPLLLPSHPTTAAQRKSFEPPCPIG